MPGLARGAVLVAALVVAAPALAGFDADRHRPAPEAAHLDRADGPTNPRGAERTGPTTTPASGTGDGPDGTRTDDGSNGTTAGPNRTTAGDGPSESGDATGDLTVATVAGPVPMLVFVFLNCTTLAVNVAPPHWRYSLRLRYLDPSTGERFGLYAGPLLGLVTDPFGRTPLVLRSVEVRIAGGLVRFRRSLPERCSVASGGIRDRVRPPRISERASDRTWRGSS